MSRAHRRNVLPQNEEPQYSDLEEDGVDYSLTVNLRDGRSMPLLGLTTDFRQFETEELVKYAIAKGYRHLDSAWIHKNEAEVGNAIQAKIHDGTVTRQDLWITTKLWNSFHGKHTVSAALRNSLDQLKLDYVDLFVMHYPFAFKEGKTFCEDIPDDFDNVDYIETWRAMEECVRLGYAKGIGLANFNETQIDRLLMLCRTPPVTNHVEVHPFLQQKDLIKFCDERNIQVIAYNPLGIIETKIKYWIEPTTPGNIFSEIGVKYNKEPHHIALNWLYYHAKTGITIKCATKQRMKEILFSFDFSMDEWDLRGIEYEDSDMRIVDCKKYQHHRFYPFEVEQPPKSSYWWCTIL